MPAGLLCLSSKYCIATAHISHDWVLPAIGVTQCYAVLLTWVNPDPNNGIVRFLRNVTEPVFYQIRRRMPFVVVSGIDLSPMVVILLIYVLQIVVVDSLQKLAYRLAALTPVLPIA